MFNSFNTTSSPVSYNYLNYHLNPNSNLLEELSYCSSYYHLPSPFIYNEINNFGDFIGHPELTSIQEGGLEANGSLIIDDSTMFRETNKADSNKGIIETINEIVLEDGGNSSLIGLGVSHGSKRRKDTKGDRHSKIRTAHGLRDRRMRLSLKVARPFFKLQDMLGYDKASRTVEWLLIQAKSAIQEQLQSEYGSISSAMITSSSNYEVQSTIIEKESLKEKNPKGNRSSTCVKKDIDKPKVMRKRRTSKESRKEARDRARKRTLERMQSQRHDNNHKLPSACSTWGGFKMVENSNVSNSQIHQSKTPSQIEDHVAGSLISKWSPLTIFQWPQNGEISLNVPSYSISMQPKTMGDQQ